MVVGLNASEGKEDIVLFHQTLVFISGYGTKSKLSKSVIPDGKEHEKSHVVVGSSLYAGIFVILN